MGFQGDDADYQRFIKEQFGIERPGAIEHMMDFMAIAPALMGMPMATPRINLKLNKYNKGLARSGEAKMTKLHRLRDLADYQGSRHGMDDLFSREQSYHGTGRIPSVADDMVDDLNYRHKFYKELDDDFPF